MKRRKDSIDALMPEPRLNESRTPKASLAFRLLSDLNVSTSEIALGFQTQSVKHKARHTPLQALGVRDSLSRGY